MPFNAIFHFCRHQFFGNLCALLLLSFYLFGCTPTAGVTDHTTSAPADEVPLRVGISVNGPPFAYHIKGKLAGLETDLAYQLGNYLGKEIEFTELAWADQLPSLEAGKIDIVMSGMTITPKRQYRAAFSKPYMKSGQMLLVRTADAGRFQNGLYSLMEQSPALGTVKGTTGDQFIVATINRPRLVQFTTSREAIRSLADGDIDVFVHDMPIVCHYAATSGENQFTPVPQMITEEYIGWAVNKADTRLLAAVNEFIARNTANGLLQQTVYKHIPFFSP